MFLHTDGWPSLTALLPALLFGIKHALEADHLAAVSTILSERRSLSSSLLVGAAWGAGHMLALIIVATLVLVLSLEIPPHLAVTAELTVAVLLIGAGLQALWRLGRGQQLHVHVHAHGGHQHWHPHFHADEHERQRQTHHPTRAVRRPLLFGLLHGLGGSAALMLIVVAQAPSAYQGLFYVLVFALGSIAGMSLMSLVMSLPLQVARRRFAYAHVTVGVLTALLSVGVGGSVAYQVALASGWLL